MNNALLSLQFYFRKLLKCFLFPSVCFLNGSNLTKSSVYWSFFKKSLCCSWSPTPHAACEHLLLESMSCLFGLLFLSFWKFWMAANELTIWSAVAKVTQIKLTNFKGEKSESHKVWRFLITIFAEILLVIIIIYIFKDHTWLLNCIWKLSFSYQQLYSLIPSRLASLSGRLKNFEVC